MSEDREGDSPERPSGGGSSGDLSRSQKRIKELVEAIDAAGDGEDVSREIDDLDYQLSITGETEIEDLRSRMSEDWGRALEEARERAERSRGRGR